MTNENYSSGSAVARSDRHEKSPQRKMPNASAEPTEHQGRHLNIQPGDQLVFVNKGSDRETSDIITLTNTSNAFVAFKVKTTAPEKFRVKPSFGCIEPAGQRTVEITVNSGFLTTAQRDKFLIMSRALEEAPQSQNELIEYWQKAATDDSEEESVEQHRLRCCISLLENNSNSTGDHGGDHPPAPYSSESNAVVILEKLEAINIKVDRLMALQHESSNASHFASQWNIFTIGFAIIVLYVGIHLIKVVLSV
ncbi:hypothetical protein BV898_17488 [Hypsibius exemplaris]|uniref:MSP domain-containing protein n=1 Tax=Hypsibius exemplaris TaxID=2072580 RepID=A0A9X6NHC4_HYPEX|nr:hypothetical protein BV898_17488 [Hypsibius exemplaris]